MKRLYIAGPMSHLPEFNYPAFDQADTWLQDAGYQTLNPADEPADPDKTWDWYMRKAIEKVIAAEGVAVLPGWECSRGARLEVDIAHALRLPVLPVAQWIESAT